VKPFRLRLAALACALLACVGPLPARAAPAPAGEPYTIDALISLTGGAAFLGQGQKLALELLADTVNKSGGVNRRPLRFNIEDDASSPQTALQLGTALIARHSPFIIGGSISATCRAVQPLITDNTIQYCISPAIVPPRNGYVFSSLISTPDLLQAVLRYARDRGWKRIAMLSSTDASGQDGDRSLTAALALPENSGPNAVQLVDVEHFGPADITVTAQLARADATKPQAYFVWTAGPALGAALRAIHDAGSDLPVVSSTADMTLEQMAAVSDTLPKGGLYFPATQLQEHSLLRPGPLRDAQDVFFRAFKDAGKIAQPTMGTAWDPGLIAIDAIRHIGGNPTAKQMHDYILALHGFPGIYSMYDFRDGLQRGMGVNSAVVAKWEPSQKWWIAVTAGGGKKFVK
jgi:branched-chain amino acid transport system substrate-binding protein